MEIGCGKREGRYDEIVLLHLIGAIMILFRHVFQDLDNAFWGELFRSGVALFLFVAGFLAGLKPKIKKGWLLGKAKRILLPYYLIVIPYLFLLWLTSKDMVSLRQWIFLLTNIQGIFPYLYYGNEIYGAVQGLSHLWFTTIIMICYLITPLLCKLIEKTNLSSKVWAIILTVFVLLSSLTEFIHIELGYILPFIIGLFISKLGIKITNVKVILLTVLTAITCGLRVVLKKYIDGTVFYDRYITAVSSGCLGAWVFFVVFWISDKFPKIIKVLANNKIISYLSEISYEFYLFHVLFWTGYWSVSNYISNFALKWIVIVALSILSSAILHFIVNLILKIINKINKKDVKEYKK